MRISPPIAILLILAVVLAGAAWLAPPAHEAAEVSVSIPMDTYQKIALETKRYADATGRTITVDQYIRRRLGQ
jgi:hypothetical protein